MTEPTQGYEWQLIALYRHGLVAPDGEIVAVVNESYYNRVVSFKDKDYISLEAAKRAAEKSVGLIAGAP